MKIGFIGQGWVGKNYANDFENRGFEIVRYSLEDEYEGNKEKIKECDFVFIAVPTPTTPEGFDVSFVKQVIGLVGKGKVAIIKSTIIPGTTERLQKENPDIFVIHSPEFLREISAADDAAHPVRNIIGIPTTNEEYREKAKSILSILPKAPYELICSSKEAEIIKYANNSFLYFKVVFANILYDLVKESGMDWKVVKEAVTADPRMGNSHMEPIHFSGRGAGGHCFIKDFALFSKMYKDVVDNKRGSDLLEALEEKNKELLKESNKDLDLLKGVYGEI